MPVPWIKWVILNQPTNQPTNQPHLCGPIPRTPCRCFGALADAFVVARHCARGNAHAMQPGAQKYGFRWGFGWGPAEMEVHMYTWNLFCPLFLGINPPRQGHVQIKTRVIWVPRYVYMCAYDTCMFCILNTRIHIYYKRAPKTMKK